MIAVNLPQTWIYRLILCMLGCCLMYDAVAQNPYKAGKNAYDTGEFQEAITLYQQALDQYRQEAKVDSLGFSFLELAVCYTELRNFDGAHAAIDSTRHIIEQLAEPPLDLLVGYYGQSAQVFFDQGKSTDAFPILREGLPIFSGKDTLSQLCRATLLAQMGGAFAKGPQQDSARKYYEASLELRKRYANNPALIGRGSLNLGATYGRLGDFELRYFYFNKALQNYSQADSVKYRKDMFFVYNNIGGHFMEKGDVETALPYFQRSLGIARDLYGENHPNTANIISNIGTYHSRRGEYPQAVKYFSKALPTLMQFLGPEHPYTAFTQQNLGFSSFHSGEKVRGIALVEEAIGVLSKRYPPSFAPLIDMYENLGKFTMEEDTEKGFTLIKKARDMRLKALGVHHPRQAKGLQLLAGYQLEDGRIDSAARSVQQGIMAACNSFENSDFSANPDLDDAISLAHLMRLLHLKARIQQMRGNLRESQQTYTLAIESLNLLRNQFYQAAGKANLQEEALELLADAAICHHAIWEESQKESDLNGLSAVVQQGKAALLTDHLRNDRALRFGGLPDSLRKKELRLQSDLVFYQTKIAEEKGKGARKDSARVERWLAQTLEIEQSQRQLQQRLERNFPAYYSLKYNTQAVNIEQVQRQLLRPGDAILEFFVAGESVFLFWIQSDKVSVEKLPAEKINTLAAALREGLRTPGGAFENSAYALYSLILGPFVQDQNIPASLTIVPDGMLGYIPFEVLLTAERSGDPRSLPYLVKQSKVRYAYALRLLLEGSGKKKSVALGGFAPAYPALAETDVQEGAIAGLVRDGLWALPGAKKEVERVAELTGGDPYVGVNATETVFRDVAAEYGILHFAMHAIVDDRDPLQSYLVFSQENDDQNDGLVYASDLYGMNLPAQLAVLSACNTGAGVLQRGEGIMSLSRAFAYAGCPSTVMSLWQAPDAETASLMEAFYTNLKDGNTKPKALHDAKLSYLENAYTPAQGHPFYWAGFIMSGDESPIGNDSHGASWKPWLLALLLTVLAGWSLLRVERS
ncbi:MAG: CHAT domain-containing protein [Bacteroidia bacterium]